MLTASPGEVDAAHLPRRPVNTKAVATVIALLPAWAVFASLLPAGLPTGVVGLGIVTGALSSFTALGLVLVYRSTRVVNFAQAEIGGVAASLSVVLVANRGMSYFAAVPLGLGIALLSGALIELTVVRRFYNAPRLILTAATIGLAQILGAAIVFMPTLLPSPSGTDSFFTEPFTTPFDVQLEIFPVTFNGNHLLAIISVALVLAGLVYLFNRTDVGIGIRGAADSQERAVLLGIPVRRLSLLSWVLAAGLSGLAGILSAGVLGSTAGSTAGPTALLAPLAAAVLARFESLPTALAASLGIGVFSQAVYWNYPKATTVDLALFAIVLLALLLQRKQSTRVTGEDAGASIGAPEVPPIPEPLRHLPEVRAARVGAVVMAAAIVIALPILSTDSRVVLYGFAAIYAIIGVSLVVLTGWAGQVSLGQFAFVGIGAATAGALSANADLDFLLCLLAAAAVGAVVAVIIGIPALRIPGLFLAPVTVAFAVTTTSVVLNPQYFEWFVPRRVEPPRLLDRFDTSEPVTFYFTCIVGLAIAMLIARNLRRTRMGRAVIAARDNERFAAAVAIEPVRVKLIAFAISGALAGFAGGLYVLAIRGLPFGAFSASQSLQLFTMVIVGGLTSVFGAVLGGVYVYAAQYALSGAAQLLATGAGLLVVLLIAPGGLAEVIYKLRDRWLRRVARRHEIDVPSFSAISEPARIERADVVVGDPGGMLSCVGVGAAYEHLQVLFGVDLSVQDGTILALLGTNGAGKTTTLRTIAGVVPANRGRIFFDGEDVTDLGPVERVQRGIVMVPAKGIFPSLTVRENLRLACWVPRHRGDADEDDGTRARVLELFPVLGRRMEQRASLLSGGEQQMLAIAQGLLARPRILMIDELSLGLAPIVVAAIIDVVRQLNESGLPVVVVEQSVNASATVASEAVFIEKGEVRFAGSTAGLADRDDLLHSVFFGADGPPGGALTHGASVARPTVGAGPVVFRADKITKTYGAVTAVADLELQVRQGEILGVIGSNGAGKTTAFDIFSGFVTPDSGTLNYRGVDITTMSAAQRAAIGFGRTFQDVRLLPALTVSEVLAVALERHIDVREPVASVLYLDATKHSERAVATRVDEILDRFGLGRYRDVCVSELSTGTRRILELACAAGHRPSFLLLDEPSSGLSQAETEQMAEVLRNLARATGATLMLIEHDVPLVAGLADELVCMDLGRVIARGDPQAVLSDPAVIRSYLGGAEPTPQTRSGRRQPLRAGT